MTGHVEGFTVGPDFISGSLRAVPLRGPEDVVQILLDKGVDPTFWRVNMVVHWQLYHMVVTRR
jgi:hypothetical protein